LAEFQLEINESKVRIREFPFAFEDEFAKALNGFDFKKGNANNRLKHYFSMVWAYAEKNSAESDTIFKYALRVFEYSRMIVPEDSWKICEDLLLKTILLEPAVLDIVIRIFLTYNDCFGEESHDKMTTIVNTIIEEHCPVHHSFEISWALWMAKTFEIEISEDVANAVIDTDDCISILVLLDLINNTALVQGNPDTEKIRKHFDSNFLFDDDWLLVYESLKKGWLQPPDPNPLDENLFFKLLNDLDVEFYDGSKQLAVFERNPKTEEIKQDDEPLMFISGF